MILYYFISLGEDIAILNAAIIFDKIAVISFDDISYDKIGEILERNVIY